MQTPKSSKTVIPTGDPFENPCDVCVKKVGGARWPDFGLLHKSNKSEIIVKSFPVTLAKAPKLQLKVYKRGAGISELFGRRGEQLYAHFLNVFISVLKGA